MIFDDMIMTFVSIMVNLFTLFHSKVIDEDPVVDGKVWPDELEEDNVRRPKPTEEVNEIGEYLGHHLTNKKPHHLRSVRWQSERAGLIMEKYNIAQFQT